MSSTMPDAEDVFAAHQPAVLRYLTRIVGQPEMARDLTQDVFVRITRTAIPDVDGTALRAWVFRIARNLAFNHLRDRARRPLDVGPVDTPAAASQETAVAVRQALLALADVDRDLFLLREIAGLSYDELASVCELSPDAVRSRLHRARTELRRLLGGAIETRRRAPLSLQRKP
jgi:RNA polymerase sigma-70 factor, ECF subfamily